MNPQRGKHMEAGDVSEESGQHHVPHIHIHPHHDESGKHVKTHVHIMHHDGKHEMHEHEPGDSEGIAAHVHQHFGGHHMGGAGQSHGVGDGSSGELEGLGV
jgi:hypothetical protein